MVLKIISFFIIITIVSLVFFGAFMTVKKSLSDSSNIKFYAYLLAKTKQYLIQPAIALIDGQSQKLSPQPEKSIGMLAQTSSYSVSNSDNPMPSLYTFEAKSIKTARWTLSSSARSDQYDQLVSSVVSLLSSVNKFIQTE